LRSGPRPTDLSIGTSREAVAVGPPLLVDVRRVGHHRVVSPDDDQRPGWLDPNDEMGLWEFQSEPLTVRSLIAALTTANEPDLPVTVEFYDGTDSRALRPVHIDISGDRGTPTAIVLTVADTRSGRA
jgi:hypothetical protein